MLAVLPNKPCLSSSQGEYDSKTQAFQTHTLNPATTQQPQKIPSCCCSSSKANDHVDAALRQPHPWLAYCPPRDHNGCASPCRRCCSSSAHQGL